MPVAVFWLSVVHRLRGSTMATTRHTISPVYVNRADDAEQTSHRCGKRQRSTPCKFCITIRAHYSWRMFARVAGVLDRRSRYMPTLCELSLGSSRTATRSARVAQRCKSCTVRRGASAAAAGKERPCAGKLGASLAASTRGSERRTRPGQPVSRWRTWSREMLISLRLMLCSVNEPRRALISAHAPPSSGAASRKRGGGVSSHGPLRAGDGDESPLTAASAGGVPGACNADVRTATL
mmetsp:Transcript_15742/g.47771  ORF Transcript_15742/g.47771 Transcript_15742/m.47771 type:complete len:237 (+) Transcript_15742:318-1028(+)|eukprot:scaffold148899_cov28-Tisochrysis_lutea.AAC.1